ncbi:antibiotic biosynthesis monooxygenase [Spirosoma spitsbergense]|uniref:antibiotic biosynthesis monooxygenase n=1 Tax=Spirosoma spitsbergense TaxID=431554 RepID=UPI00035DEA70|nr:antibiotic biosynthesis monooxygenase [Spirosoma spitsbergense]
MIPSSNPVSIHTETAYVTEINFMHVEPDNQQPVVECVQQAAQQLAQQPGLVSVSIFRSTDGTRVATYIQWQTADQLQ